MWIQYNGNTPQGHFIGGIRDIDSLLDFTETEDDFMDEDSFDEPNLPEEIREDMKKPKQVIYKYENYELNINIVLINYEISNTISNL